MTQDQNDRNRAADPDRGNRQHPFIRHQQAIHSDTGNRNLGDVSKHDVDHSDGNPSGSQNEKSLERNADRLHIDREQDDPDQNSNKASQVEDELRKNNPSNS